MPDHLTELAELITEAGGTMRLYGKPITVDDLRKHAAGSAASRLTAAAAGMHRTPGNLPTPRLTATVYPPARRHDLGAVVVTLGGRTIEPEAAPRDRYTVTAVAKRRPRGA